MLQFVLPRDTIGLTLMASDMGNLRSILHGIGQESASQLFRDKLFLGSFLHCLLAVVCFPKQMLGNGKRSAYTLKFQVTMFPKDSQGGRFEPS